MNPISTLLTEYIEIDMSQFLLELLERLIIKSDVQGPNLTLCIRVANRLRWLSYHLTWFATTGTSYLIYCLSARHRAGRFQIHQYQWHVTSRARLIYDSTILEGMGNICWRVPYKNLDEESLGNNNSLFEQGF